MNIIPGFVVIASIASLLLAGCLSPNSPSASTISKIESRALPEDVVIYRVVNQLGDILHLIPPAHTSQHPVNQLDKMLFWTTPRATDTAGVCSADLVDFEFTAARPGQPDAATPTRVTGVSSNTWYRYLPEAPGDPDVEQTPEQFARLQAQCEQIDPYQGGFFVTASPWQASWTARLFARAQHEAILSPKSDTLVCVDKDPDCAKTFSGLPPVFFAETSYCGHEGKYPDEADCWKFESQDATVLIRTKGSGANNQILKVDFEWNIWVGSVRID